jgi:hypothetical protein
MAYKTISAHGPRPKRYTIHARIYFREPGSPTWSEGTTDNISATGVLFRASSSLSLDTALEFRLHVAMAGKSNAPAVIRGKGVVVRLEERGVAEAPVALAVAMRDCRIVREPSLPESPTKRAWSPPPHGGLALAGAGTPVPKGLY